MTQLTERIKNIILENQKMIGMRSYYPREMQVERLPGKATVITGIRRCGKSVYENLYMKELLETGVKRDNLCIIDF